MKFKNFLLTLLGGTFLGMFFANKKGSVLRKNLKNKSVLDKTKILTQEIKGVLDDMNKVLNETLEKEEFQELLEKGENKTQEIKEILEEKGEDLLEKGKKKGEDFLKKSIKKAENLQKEGKKKLSKQLKK
jgi:transcriptional regulator of heat shock response